MWKVISDWLLAFLNMTRELQDHRTAIHQLDDRLRNLEQAIHMLAQEQRHARELEAVEREKLLLRLERELPKPELFSWNSSSPLPRPSPPRRGRTFSSAGIDWAVPSPGGEGQGEGERNF